MPGVDSLDDPEGLEGQAQSIAFLDLRRGFEAGVPEGVMRLVERMASDNSMGTKVRQRAIDIAMDNAQKVVPAILDHLLGNRGGPGT